jgi:hypothetical protein
MNFVRQETHADAACVKAYNRVDKMLSGVPWRFCEACIRRFNFGGFPHTIRRSLSAPAVLDTTCTMRVLIVLLHTTRDGVGRRFPKTIQNDTKDQGPPNGLVDSLKKPGCSSPMSLVIRPDSSRVHNTHSILSPTTDSSPTLVTRWQL